MAEAGTAGAVAENADPFRALAETTPDAIITADRTGRIGYVNPAAERLLGYAAAEMVGEPVAMIVPEHLRDLHHAGFDRFIRTREPRLVGTTIVVDARRSDGSLVPVELSLGVAGGDDDLTLTAVVRDISERVRHQRNLAAQLAVTGILTGRDEPGQESRVVEALTAALGWDVGALWLVDGEQLQLVELWQADPAATARFAAASRSRSFGRGEGTVGLAWATEQPLWLDEARRQGRFLRAEAAAADELTTGVVLPLITEGEVIGVMELFARVPEPVDHELRDMLATVASQIGESLRRQQHAAELVRSNADLEQFASVVAHDLAEPLRTISGFAELLRRRGGENLDGGQADFIAAIETSARRGQQILDGIFGVARVGSGAWDPQPADLNLVVEEVLVGLRGMIDASGAEVEIARLPTVRGDATLLGQVFQNLFVNAIKFRREVRPQLSVSAERLAAAWRIDVADNGRGIESTRDVFQMFARAGSPDEVGLGIGLAVCQKIVDRHGGTLAFDTEPGRGTTFRFTIPV